MKEFAPKAVHTAMIADDTQFSRDRLRNILMRWGYTVIAEAVDGIDAVAKYCEFRPGVTFMNIIMPRKDGLEATKEIVTFDENAKVVLCGMTEQDSLIKAAVEAGAIAMVYKPFKAERVMEILDAAMEV